jgi:hypothetical protein
VAPLFRNSSFKIKAGKVATTIGIVPEAGAFLFDKSIPGMVAGDGFNWLPVVPAVVKSSIATTLVTPTIVAYTIGVPYYPAVWYDTVVYQFGTDIIVSGGDTLTLGKDMTLDFSSQFIVNSNQNNTTFKLETLINGTPINVQEVLLASNTLGYSILNIGAVLLSSGDVAEIRATADRNCDIELRSSDTGAREV